MPTKTKTARAKTAVAKKKTSTAAKKTTAKKSTNVKKPAAKKTAPAATREINEETGFSAGTDQDQIATALLVGGESRAEIAEKVKKKIGEETRNGTPKPVTNMISGVLNKMLAQGYTVESSFKVLPPTPASKRAATRAKNAKEKAAAAAPAKKTGAKRGPGRPKGSKNKSK